MDTFRDKAGEPIGTDIDNWVASFTRMESGSSELPPHHPNCLGCGPENPNGHFLSVRRDGDGVVAHHQFDQRHVGFAAEGIEPRQDVGDMALQILAVGGEPGPAAQLLIYPSLDLGWQLPSHRELADAYILPRIRVRWYTELYLSSPEQAADKRIEENERSRKHNVSYDSDGD